MKLRLSTVNIIELVDGNPIGVVSYPDTARGNRAAERLFRKLYREHNDPDGTTGIVQPTKEDFDAMIDDGIYDDECGYQITITHSN